MGDRSELGDAFGLRWLQDDSRGRVVYTPGGGEFRSPADAINLLGLGCEETALRESLDRFPPHLRIHGGYTPFLGDPVTRFSLTWEPGAGQAFYSQTQDGSEDRTTGNIDVPPGGALNDVLKELLVPDAGDVVDLARESGRKVSIEDVDFWIGDLHFKVAGEDA
jgi:hypothetical protein